MKILMFSETYGGETTTFIRNSVNAILESGVEVMYLCSNFIPGNEIFHRNFSIQVVPRELNFMQKFFFKIFKHEYSILFLRNSRLSKVYEQILDDFKPDLIHCQFFNEALWLLENVNIKEQKVICQFHGYDASKLLGIGSYVSFLKKYNKYDNIIFCFVSNSLKENVEKTIRCKINHSTILSCGIDTAKFKNEINRNELKIIEYWPIKFLQISSLTEKKGHITTLKAMSKFKKKYPNLKFTYTICGDGPFFNEIKSLIQSLDLTKNVLLIGKITPFQAINFLSDANVFVHHSITSKDGDQEGIPTAIMEAMSMGIPVVSTNHSGIPELVTNNVNGLLVNENDMESFVDALHKILYFNSYIPESVLKIEKDFSYSVHKLNLIRMYRSFYETSNLRT